MGQGKLCTDLETRSLTLMEEPKEERGWDGELI